MNDKINNAYDFDKVQVVRCGARIPLCDAKDFGWTKVGVDWYCTRRTCRDEASYQRAMEEDNPHNYM